MMKNTVRKVILMRHAESTKNTKKIHGGKGERLTALGNAQAIEAAKFLSNKIDLTNLKIISSVGFHTTATAKIISEILNTSVECSPAFSPLYFGIADGLSEQELTKKYPKIQVMFENWRNRKFDIKKLFVPQMENYMDFWNRGVKFLNTLPKDYDIILICSNSLMILLTHIMLGNHPEYSENYKHIPIQNCGIISFDTCNLETFSLNPTLTTVNL